MFISAKSRQEDLDVRRADKAAFNQAINGLRYLRTLAPDASDSESASATGSSAVTFCGDDTSAGTLGHDAPEDDGVQAHPEPRCKRRCTTKDSKPKSQVERLLAAVPATDGTSQDNQRYITARYQALQPERDRLTEAENLAEMNHDAVIRASGQLHLVHGIFHGIPDVENNAAQEQADCLIDDDPKAWKYQAPAVPLASRTRSGARGQIAPVQPVIAAPAKRQPAKSRQTAKKGCGKGKGMGDDDAPVGEVDGREKEKAIQPQVKNVERGKRQGADALESDGAEGVGRGPKILRLSQPKRRGGVKKSGR